MTASSINDHIVPFNGRKKDSAVFFLLLTPKNEQGVDRFRNGRHAINVIVNIFTAGEKGGNY